MSESGTGHKTMIERDPESLNVLSSILLPVAAGLETKIQAVYLHGSWGTGCVLEGSDIDLAILAETRLGSDERSRIFSAVYSAFGGDRNVDVSELFHADCVFSAQVVTKGQRILTFDRDAADRFEMLVLAKYARLNEERSGIVADIQRRGTVYLTGAAA